MINNEITESYARAIIELSDTESKTKKLLSNLNSINEVINKNEKYAKLISLRTLGVSERHEIVDGLFGKGFDKNFYNATKVMCDKNELFHLIEIIKLLISYCYDKLEILKGIIYSAAAVNKKQMDRISKILEGKLKKKVLLENVIDKKIIGGVKVEFKDKVFDGSIAGKLNDLNIKLKEGK